MVANIPTDSTALHKSNHDPGSILFLLNALGIGGSERKTVGVVNELHRRGWNVHLAYLDARTPLLASVSTGVPVLYLARKGKLSAAAANSLRSYIQHHRISRIVCVSLYPYMYAQIACASLRRWQRPPVTLMINATTQLRSRRRWQMLLYRPLIRRAHRVVFGCKAQRELWLDRHRLDEKKCEVIYNGIDATRFSLESVNGERSSLERAMKLCDSDFVIGSVGTLWPNKNHIELIEALAYMKATLPGARLVIAGEGPERAKLEAAARKSGVNDRVTLLGEIKDVRPLLARMDVFVLPSISETFSNAALEAMAMERVVILSDTGGMRELAQDGVDGFIYERGNVQALAALIQRLAADPDTRRTIGRRARATVVEKFSFDRMMSDYQRMLLESPGTGPL